MEKHAFPNVQQFDWGSIVWLIEPNEMDIGRVSVGLVTFYPHVHQLEHHHTGEEQVIYVLSGYGSHKVNGQYGELKPGKYIHLPTNARHELSNESENDLTMLIVYAPSKLHSIWDTEHAAPALTEDKAMAVFDFTTLGPIMERLSQALGLSLALLDVDGKCLIKTSNHPVMCSHMAAITDGEYCQIFLHRIFKAITDYNKPQFFFCCNNISSIIIPITYAGKIHAYLKCGEIFLSKDYKQRLVHDVPLISAIYGIDQDFLYKAVDELAIEPKSRLHTAAEAMLIITNTLVNMVTAHARQNALNNIRLSLVREQLATARLEKALQECGLKLLQAQINPHFLFNTLNTIAQMAYVEGATRASEITCNLSELLRYTLRKTEQLIPLGDELQLLNRYIDIQKERFGDRIRFDVSIDEGVAETLVPCLILQPLVENAIIHGLEPREEGGVITLRVTRRRRKVRAELSDNGMGFDPLAHSAPVDKVGLKSIKTRLGHHFGKAHGFVINSAPGEGTRITLDFPLDGPHDPH